MANGYDTAALVLFVDLHEQFHEQGDEAAPQMR